MHTSTTDRVVLPDALFPLPDKYPSFTIVDDADKIVNMVTRLDKSRVIAVDTETTGNHPVDDVPVCIGLYGDSDPDHAYVIPLGFKNLDAGEKNAPRSSVVEALRYLLGDSDRTICAHNIKFDANMLANIGVEVRGTWWDSLYGCFLLKSRDLELIGLKEQAKKRLGMWISDYATTVDKPSTVIKRLAEEPLLLVSAYCAMDVVCHYHLALHVRSLLKKEARYGTTKSLWTLAEVGSRLIKTCYRMERRGFCIDLPLLRVKTKKAEEDLLACEKRVYVLAAKHGPEWGDPKRFNLNSSDQLNRLFTLMGIDKHLPCTDVWRCDHYTVEQVQLKTKVKDVRKRCKGVVRGMQRSWNGRSAVMCPECGSRITPRRAAGKDSIEILDNIGVPFAEKLAERKKIATLLQTFLRPMEARISRKTGRVHATVNVTGARTGRLSYKDPNLQNIPTSENDKYGIREIFIAPPGKKLVVADFSQLELRILAHFSHDETLVQAFLRGEDPHAVTGAKALGWPVKKMLRLLKEAKALAKADRAGEITKEMHIALKFRKVGKVFNFAISYGAGPAKLARIARITLEEAMAFLEKHQKIHGGVYQFKRACVALAEKTGYSYTILGFRRPLAPFIYSSDKRQRSMAERQAVNTSIQGSAANIAGMAMILLDERDGVDEDYEASLLLQVHDELVFEVPEDVNDHTLKTIKRTMESPFAEPLSVAMLVDPGIGSSWAAAKAA